MKEEPTLTAGEAALLCTGALEAWKRTYLAYQAAHPEKMPQEPTLTIGAAEILISETIQDVKAAYQNRVAKLACLDMEDRIRRKLQAWRARQMGGE